MSLVRLRELFFANATSTTCPTRSTLATVEGSLASSTLLSTTKLRSGVIAAILCVCLFALRVCVSPCLQSLHFSLLLTYTLVTCLLMRR